MPLALLGMSHSPLLDIAEHPAELTDDVLAAIGGARDFAEAFDPEIVVLFAPDHWNGFFGRLMPPFAIGLAASGVGDYGTTPGPLDVPTDFARECAQAVLDAGVDLAVSARMDLDHGAVQPLEKLFGDPAARPVVPIFINAVQPPFGPIRRVRALGEALGTHLATRPERILLVASGGLSHDPPVPTLETAPPEVAERLITGRAPTLAERAARTERVIAAGAGFADGTEPLQPLNPDWDAALLDLFGGGDLSPLDSWSNAWVVEQGGGSAHEVRTWIAAHAAMSAAGPYEVTSRYYRAIPEYIAGFAVATVRHRAMPIT